MNPLELVGSARAARPELFQIFRLSIEASFVGVLFDACSLAPKEPLVNQIAISSMYMACLVSKMSCNSLAWPIIALLNNIQSPLLGTVNVSCERHLCQSGEKHLGIAVDWFATVLGLLAGPRA